MASKGFQILPIKISKSNIYTFIIFFIPSIYSLEFKYPTAITLPNKKIFVIHSLGIDICDSSYTTSTKIIEFNQEINQSYLSMISISKYSNGDFIVLIIDIIYIFNSYGKKLIEYPLREVYNAEYFTLSAHKITNKNCKVNYFFLLGYIDKTELKLNLFYFCFDKNSKTINIKSSIIDYSYYFKNTGVSCEFVLYEANEYILCVYEIHEKIGLLWDNDIIFSFFQINEDSIINIMNKDYDKLLIEYFRSTTKSIDSKAFYCGINENENPICFIYDYSDTYSSNMNYDKQTSKYCIKIPYNIKTYYFPETGEYVFSCLTTSYGIYTSIYNKDMEETSDIKYPSQRIQRTIEGCNSEFYYSIIYNKSRRKYYAISDIECGTHEKFFPLIEGDIDEPDNEEVENSENEGEINKENEQCKIEEKEENKIKEAENEKESSEDNKKEDKEKEKAIEKEKGKEKEKENEKVIEKEKEKVIEKEKGKEKEKVMEKEKEKENEEIEHVIEKENQSKNCILEKCSECTE